MTLPSSARRYTVESQPHLRIVVERETIDAIPFVKWAGGKRSMIPHIRQMVPEHFGTYHEPFVGGGALFFSLRPKRAFLSDNNSRLIRTYRAIRSNAKDVIELLRRYPHSKSFFLRLRQRNIDSCSDEEVAAWFLYLNKTCFNGLYRVNRSDRFNVPFGGYSNPTICDEYNLRACSRFLKRATVRCNSFETVLDRAIEGDFVYFDPPYLPISTTSSFTGYTTTGFGLRDHILLRDVALELKSRRVRVLISNSSAPAIRGLYAKGFDIVDVHAPRVINSKGACRGKIAELLIY